MNERKQRIEALFDAALELTSAEQREVYLCRAAGDDPQLCQEVEGLIQAYEKAGRFLAAQTETPLGGTMGTPTPTRVGLSDAVGKVIGRYKLLEMIGEGGCGVVYMAEQVEPIRRKVALKLIKAGMDSKSVMARFEAERQALALMDHPNIAKVFDAGATESGRPYFVMELVPGMRITNYCDQAKLSIAARLDLFISICQAVQHAHQKGIIHRDLKPSNILVTVNDSVALPKVIDFGIAKATGGQQLTNETVFTAFEQFIGTPAYMSPEQALLTSLDVDTRSDIYSLGVLLYEMLTGKTPFDSKDLLAVGLDEMRRTILEKEPDRPSTRLGTMSGDELGTAANRRGIGPPKLISELRGDLDWVVMKALEKPRDRRYPSAAELAADVRRHLKNEPVLATPPSRIYRAKKWARRNRIVVAAGISVATAILIGLVVSAWQWRTARREAIRSGQVAQFLEDMLKGVKPSVAQGQDTKLLRQILDKTAQRLDQDLKDQPEVEAELCSVLGGVYTSVGDYSNAAAMHGKALVLRTNLFGLRNLKVADSLGDLGGVAWHQGRYPEAERLEEQSLAIRTNLLGTNNIKVADSFGDLGTVFWYVGDWQRAEPLMRQSLAICRKLLGNKNADMVLALENLAGLLSNEDKFPEAEAAQREALKLNIELLGTNHPDVGYSLNNLADTLEAEGKLPEAESFARQALALRMNVLGTNHPDYAHSIFELGNILADEGNLTEAESMQRQALAIRRHLFGETNLDVAGSLNNLGGILQKENKLPEAESSLRQALAIEQLLLKPDHEDVLGSLSTLAAILGDERKWQEAESVQRKALAAQEQKLGEHLDVATSYYTLASLLRADGKFGEAETNANRSLVLRRKLLGDNHADVAVGLALLGRIRADQKDLLGAEDCQRKELAVWHKLLGTNSPPLLANVQGFVDSRARLIETLLALQDYAGAESPAREAVAFTEKELPSDWQCFRARSLLGGVLSGQRKFAEAEPLLLSGYDGLAQTTETIPADDRDAIADAIQRMIVCYQESSQPDKAAAWKAKLDSLNSKK